MGGDKVDARKGDIATTCQISQGDGVSGAKAVPFWRRYINQVAAAEVSSFSRYYDQLWQWSPRPTDSGVLLEMTDCPVKKIAYEFEDLPDLSGNPAQRGIFLLNRTLNYDLDIQHLLQQLKGKTNRSSRIVVIISNAYFNWLYKLAQFFRISDTDRPCTFLTTAALKNLAEISGYELVRERFAMYCPFRLLGLGDLINAISPLIPFWRNLGWISVSVLRPKISEVSPPSLTVIVPARNERGNIESVFQRMPSFGDASLEIIFVEGHSADGTWEEIERVTSLYQERFDIKAFKQPGIGKSDAVRFGLQQATKEVVVILDSDLSVPPELLTRFYDAYKDGLADFINGSRLVYPIEGAAMKFLNKIGNVFFAKLLSRILSISIGDSLCGTKLFSRDTYGRMVKWRSDFGDFDPFGDFELLFPAAQLGLGTVDIPIRYRDRLYGTTNIRRFYHGMMLLKMTLIGLFKITLGKVRTTAGDKR